MFDWFILYMGNLKKYDLAIVLVLCANIEFVVNQFTIIVSFSCD